MNVTIENRWQREYEIYCVKLKENKTLKAYSCILSHAATLNQMIKAWMSIRLFFLFETTEFT